MGLEGSATHDNLLHAFQRVSQASRRYLWFAQLADVEGFPEVAALFRSVAERGTGHAMGHLEYLAELGDPLTGQPIGDTADNLAAASAGEAEGADELYPSFAEVARAEGFDHIAEWFEIIAAAEKSQAASFQQGSTGM